jgi:cell pole-organizing protein PopZ
MSSTEQAPEPTMDEILASIRKIIADDESDESSPPEDGAPPQESSVPPQPEAAPPEADAPRVEMPAPEPAAPPAETAAQDKAAEAVDDILDLTQALEPQTESEPVQGDTMQAALAETPAEPAQPDASDAAGAGSEAEMAAVLLAEAGVRDSALDAAAPTPAPTPEETSITEAFSAMDESPVAPAPELQMDASMPDDDFEANEASATKPEVQDDSVIVPPPPADMPAAEASDEGALADFEDDFAAMTEEVPQPEAQEEPAAEAPALAIDQELAAVGFAGLDAGGAAGDEPAEEAVEDIQEQESVAADGSEGKTFEESVKDMLRPMLRSWLDENMERIVHDAVRDEVASGNLPGKD